MNLRGAGQTSQDPIVVWIVEDNEIYRRSIRQLLDASEGYECGGDFHRCEEALESLRRGEAPSVILLDVGLPGISGIQGIPRIAAISPSTKIVILTIHEEYGKVFDAICAGASGYLLKSTSPEGILGAISDVMAGGAPMNAQIARRVLDLFANPNAGRDEYGLTGRERDILRHLVDGDSKRQIADALFISHHTVDTHLKNIYLKLQVHSRAGAVVKVLKERLI